MFALHRDCQLVPPSGATPGVSYLALIGEMRALHASEPARWRIDGQADPGETWIQVSHEWSHPPQQGWKLHVSATAWSAEAVLRQALPVLLVEAVRFKVAASPEILTGLNDGSTGHLSQIGKFITIYPNDDDQAVRLAVALDEQTRGLHGPPVPSDRPLRRGSLVHYRYGGFGGEVIQTPLGEITLAIRTPTGELVPDIRSPLYQAPEWAADPFEAAGVVEEIQPPPRVIGSRFAIASPLHHSPRGLVHLGLDVEALRSCILKQAWFGAQPAPDGTDSRGRLRREAAILALLAPDDRIPQVFDLIEQNGDLFLAMEDVAGETLEEIISHASRRGLTLPTEQIVDYGRQIASMLGKIHDSGYTYGDVKPTNVIVAPNGRLRFVDFELARELDGAQGPPAGLGSVGLGTRGYMSPQQAEGKPPAVTDDVYGLGSLLFLMATGAEPSRAPRPYALLDRPLRLLNPAIDPTLADIIRRCLDPHPAGRFPTMVAVEAALRAVGSTPAFNRPPTARTDFTHPNISRATAAGNSLGDWPTPSAPRRVRSGTGPAWRGSAPTRRRADCGPATSTWAAAERCSRWPNWWPPWAIPRTARSWRQGRAGLSPHRSRPANRWPVFTSARRVSGPRSCGLDRSWPTTPSLRPPQRVGPGSPPCRLPRRT